MATKNLSSYIVRVYTADFELVRQFDGFATPMDAMTTLNEFFISQGGYGSIAYVFCQDEDTGYRQWVFEVC